MLIRRLARPLLAAVFVHGGIQALRDVTGHAKAIQPFVDKTVRKFGDALPAEVPTDAETLIRIDGAMKLGAGTALAVGKFPRLAALVLAANTIPSTLAAHAFWEIDNDEQRFAQRIEFLKNAGLFGGLLIAAMDTQGKPSIAYRARSGAERTTRAARKAAR